MDIRNKNSRKPVFRFRLLGERNFAKVSCRLFIRTGKHRCQTGYTGNQAEDGQYSYFGLPIVHTPEQDNAPAISEADIAKLPFYTYWHTACASDVHPLTDGTHVVPLADWEAFCRRLVLTGR